VKGEEEEKGRERRAERRGSEKGGKEKRVHTVKEEKRGKGKRREEYHGVEKRTRRGDERRKRGKVRRGEK
jgi:hypothetical protein